MKAAIVSKYITRILLCSLYCMNAYGNDATVSVHVRRATEHDIPAALELDRSVTFEFFKPLYETHYAHLPYGKDIDHFLLSDMAKDEQYFPESLDDASPRRLLIAQDMSNNAIVGLVLFHRE